MKRAYFACVFLCLTTTFLFPLLHLPPSNSQAAQGISRPRFRMGRALPLPHLGAFGPGRPLRRPPSSLWDEAKSGSSQRKAGNRLVGAPNRHAWNSVLLSAPTYSSGGRGALSVAVGDVNADGKPDLMVANNCDTGNCNGGSVGVLLGHGDGTFYAAVSYASGGPGATSVAVGDVNGDGKPDLLVANGCADANCTNSSVGVLLGNGDGTFQAAVSYDSGGRGALSVAVGE